MNLSERSIINGKKRFTRFRPQQSSSPQRIFPSSSFISMLPSSPSMRFHFHTSRPSSPAKKHAPACCIQKRRDRRSNNHALGCICLAAFLERDVERDHVEQLDQSNSANQDK